jgi:hypothetical protein
LGNGWITIGVGLESDWMRIGWKLDEDWMTNGARVEQKRREFRPFHDTKWSGYNVTVLPRFVFAKEFFLLFCWEIL